MARLAKFLIIVVGLALALVAGVFGLIVVALIVVAALVFSLFGKGNVRVVMNRGRRGPGPSQAGAAPPPAGDVIDVEAKKVEPPKRELT